MRPLKLEQTLAAGVITVALFNTLSALSFPVEARKPALLVVLLWDALLVAHALLYWYGARIRARLGLRGYTAAQAAVIFAVGATGALFPVGLALLMAFTAEMVILAGRQWGTIPITLGAILLYVLNSLIASNLYGAATAGMVLAATALIAHAIAALVRRERPGIVEQASAPAGVATPIATAVSAPPAEADLTPREAEVLRALVKGTRNSQIAEELGISERTVKTHLARVYQKLGVESRSGAVAAAVQRQLVENGSNGRQA
jgi:DNA-binding CsgD family transcriptional regulator